MIEDQYNPSEIDRDERWLAEQLASTGQAEALSRAEVLSHVKAAVRATVEADQVAMRPTIDADTLTRLSRVKHVVREKLIGPADAGEVTPPVVFRPFAPLMVAAAAVAFAFVTLNGGVFSESPMERDLDLFVSVMDDGVSDATEVDVMLADLAGDVAYIETSSSYWGEFGREFDVLLDEVESVLDGESREGAS